MADDYMWDPDPPGEQRPGNKPGVNMKIVAYNLLTLVSYTILLKFVDEGEIYDALLIAGQLFACLIIAIVQRSGYWVLSGLLVLVIGFSTCVLLGGGIR